MHIGAGQFEGKVLKNADSFRGISCRALTTKESIFSFIGSRILGATVLDVNDANGMYGIESLSREAAVCRFVNPDKEEVKVIAENLDNLGIENKEILFNVNVEEFLDNPLNQEIEKEKYDVIFFEIRESGDFGLVNKVFNKQKKTGVTALIFPNLTGFNLPKIIGGKIFETREFEDRKLALLIKNEK